MSFFSFIWAFLASPKPQLIVSVFFAPTLLLGFFTSVGSEALSTYKKVEDISEAIKAYHQKFGYLPSQDLYWRDLHDTKFYLLEIRQLPTDEWMNPFVYRIPGQKNRLFDFYSVGPDGIDDEGLKDDVTLHRGVNEGYHWKKLWPIGKSILALSLAFSFVLLALRNRFSSKPFVSMCWFCLFMVSALGCKLLMHPLVDDERNAHILLVLWVLFMLAAISLMAFAEQIRKRTAR